MPEVSVIIPTYNSARYLAAAIDTVLGQTFRDLEVLVIDDGSSDETPSVMAKYATPVRYVRQENQGVSVARNHGLELARGGYVAFLDSDDTWLPGKLEKQVAVLKKAPGVRACYSAFIAVDNQLSPLGVRRSRRNAHALDDLMLRGNVVGSIGTVLCERALFDAAGGFDPELSQCADWDMWVRLAQHTDFLYIDEPTVTYRQHETNMSRRPELLERDSLRVLEKAFSLPEVPEHLRRQRRRAYGRNYMVLAGTYFVAGRPTEFLRCALRALVLDPRQVTYLAAFPWRRFQRRVLGKWQEDAAGG
jgi:glycosyltransferase involved in cell wall biosynthesis